ncbi:IclR family transcriptional regulator [Rhodospirillum sp. A1_3_36]|uniref:IclR family transcriptional regulator n=1 Tax=Rhodospirillum sp. A1_3_36 TaxID=3391666 RepID=UPI0039A57F8D
MVMKKKEKQDTLFVASLEKGLRVMAVFGEDHTELGLHEIATLSGLDKSACQRFANTLHKLGYLSKDPETRRYRPTIRYLELGSAYLWADPLVQLALPKLIELSHELGERVNCARLVGEDIVYITRIPTQMTNFGATVLGRRLPALNTASGRAIVSALPLEERRIAAETWPIVCATSRTITDRTVLAEALERAAGDGYAITESQNLMNEIAVAAPIYDRSGRPVAAVQCSTSSLKMSEERVRAEYALAIIEVANSIQPPR